MSERRKIKYLYLTFIRKINNFLLSDKSRELLIFLFFFFMAAAFWLLQTLNRDYEAEFAIPLRLKGVPDRVMITSELPSELRIKVKDKGTVLINYLLVKSFLPVTIDFDEQMSAQNHVTMVSSELEKIIQAQLQISTRLLRISPDTLEYIYTTGQSKLVPVQLVGQVEAAPQYYISDTLFTPDSVLVYAPTNILKTITAAYTNPVAFDHIADTLHEPLSLAHVKGAKFVPNQTDLILSVDSYTEKTVEVPILGINFPADKLLRTFPSKVLVTFQVGVSRFSQITAADFVATVSYEELLKLGAGKYPVKLKGVPTGISYLRIVPEQVDFLIEQNSSYGH